MVQTTAFGLYLASRFSLAKSCRALCFVLALLLAAFAASALLDPAAAFATPGHPGAFRGPLVHKNQVALLMALAIPALLIRICDERVSALLFGVALAAAASSSCWRIPRRDAGGGDARLGVVAATACSALRARGCCCCPPWWLRSARRRQSADLLDGVLVALGKDPTLTGRTEIWEHAWPLLAERPLLGHSMASFWQPESSRARASGSATRTTVTSSC